MLLSNGLNLFIADIIDEDTNEQIFWYVVGKTRNSALKRFKKEANKIWYRYAYYFYEADEETTQDFTEKYENIKAGVYE